MPAPLRITNTDCTANQLRKFARRCKNNRQGCRMRAIARKLGGMAPKEIAQRSGTTIQSIGDWTIRFDQDGIDGLADSSRTGRPGCLNQHQRALLEERVEAGACSEDGGLVRWRLRDLVDWAGVRFDLSISVSAMHRMMRNLDSFDGSDATGRIPA